MNHKAQRVAVAILGTLLLGMMGRAQADLIVNGDFSLGNTGFSTDYTYSTGTLGANNTYLVGVNPHTYHSGGASFTDHTSGTGLMLLANGYVQANKAVWRQSLAVEPNTTYTFSGWAASWGDAGTIDPHPAILDLQINGSSLGALSLPAADGVWIQFHATWNSQAATSATLGLVDKETNWYGNDFAVDDLSFSVPEPTSASLLLVAAAGVLRRRRGR